jgi:hypothetical protein
MRVGDQKIERDEVILKYNQENLYQRRMVLHLLIVIYFKVGIFVTRRQLGKNCIIVSYLIKQSKQQTNIGYDMI